MLKKIDEFEQKTQDLIHQGIRSEEIAQKILSDLPFEDLSRFVIDLNIPDDLLGEWIQSLPNQKSLNENSQNDLINSLHSGNINTLMKTCARNNVTKEDLRNCIIQMAKMRNAKEIIEILLDNDYNFYEIYCTLLGEPNYSQRISQLNSLLEQKPSTEEILLNYGKTLKPLDQLILCYGHPFSQDELKPFAVSLGISESDFIDFSPQHLITKIKDPTQIQKHLITLFKNVPLDKIAEILKAREKARSCWFQSIGPNIEACFSGILNQSPPNKEGNSKLPDFNLVLYRAGIVRAIQIGIDGLVSTKTETFTIGHAYEGELIDNQILLKEVSRYSPHPKRPTLGDIQLNQFQIKPSGLEAQFTWQEKMISLDWHPGF